MAKKKPDRHKTPRQMMPVLKPLHAGLKVLAERNHRPVSWELWLLIETHLRENGIDPDTGEPVGESQQE